MSESRTDATASGAPRGRVAVVGSGVIGRSWIQVFARAGHAVQVWDPSPDAVSRAISWQQTEEARTGAACAPVVACASLEAALAGCEWVQESGPERLEAKQALFAQLDAIAAPTAILASSTSTMSMTAIAEGLPGATRCIVAHPVNPPHVVPAVEVLGGDATSPETVRRTEEMLSAVGQVPVRMHRYVPGFLLNRMQAALVREAISLVERGVADVDAIDAVIRDGLGLRWALMGPFGVANTNADGGVREYFTRYGASFRALMDDLGPTPAFDASLIETIGAQVDAMTGGTPLEAQRAWRDRLVQRLVTLKREEPAP
jgi:L-gulonate 3-dehydrogenase